MGALLETKIKPPTSDDQGFVADESSLVDKMLKILESGGGDITVKSRTRSVTAFSAILSATSEPLRKMLGDKFKEQHEKIISFENYGYQAVRFFIFYIHGDMLRSPITYTDTFDLMELCEMYGLKKYLSYLIEIIHDYTTEENAINILCLCDHYIRISTASKITIRRVAKKILFEKITSVMKTYFQLTDITDGLESKKAEEDFESVTDQLRLNMLERIMREYCVLLVRVPLTRYCDEYPNIYKTDGKIFEMYPQIKPIFKWVQGQNYHWIDGTDILKLQSTDDYIVIKKTFSELEFIFI
ncbi:MAG: hypothetical protein Hyperionvirus1_144 [Hyperionvirus sp.]|uniref:BTB domain-containing protein n=1 Tax=Hyperionvirus sp. TaxID=2487770 RepID=A0A3G5A5P4_9VIRU|nr:MAG: hypothetical protein Hyperionvirus1_144 [Hyperionvirus sp.]